jgi:hypothetical protein
MATQTYVDIGAVQRPLTGSPGVNYTYIDVGAIQVQETAVGGGLVVNPMSGRGGGAAHPVYMKAA